MRVSRHACERFMERVICTDDYDEKNLEFAAKILNDMAAHIDLGISVDLPIVGFKGSYLRVENNCVVTVINK